MATIRDWYGAEGLSRWPRRAAASAMPDRFRLRSRSARVGDIELTYLVHAPARFTSMGANFGHREDTVRLVVVLDGSVVLGTGNADRGERTVGSRDSVLMAGWETTTYAASSPVRALIIDAPAAVASLPGLEDGAPIRVAHSPAVLPSALSAYALEILRQDLSGLSSPVRAQMTESLISLYHAAASAHVDSPTRDTRRDELRACVEQLIARNYADPDFSQKTLARRLGLSTRTLQRLFEDEGSSVTRKIAARRVEQVLARLRDPRYAHVPLDEIAVLAGYSSALILRRAVIAATGHTPTQVRAEALAALASSAKPAA